MMSQKRRSPEQIIGKLREAEVELAQGATVGQVSKPGEWISGVVRWEAARDELLNGEIFDALLEAQVLTERWRRYYSVVRPRSALNY